MYIFLLFLNRTAHGEALFSGLALDNFGFSLGDFISVDAAQAFAFGVNVLGNIVCFLKSLIKDTADDTQAEVPCRVIIV